MKEKKGQNRRSDENKIKNLKVKSDSKYQKFYKTKDKDLDEPIDLSDGSFQIYD